MPQSECTVLTNFRNMALPSSRSYVFSHAAGLCKEVWYPITRRLLQLLPNVQEQDIHCIDLDGHGERHHIDTSQTDWLTFSTKNVRSCLQTVSRPVVGIGHSMGASALVNAHLSLGRDGFQSLILFEPVFTLPGAKAPPGKGLVPLTLKRRRWFDSRDDALTRFQKGLFSVQLEVVCKLKVCSEGCVLGILKPSNCMLKAALFPEKIIKKDMNLHAHQNLKLAFIASHLMDWQKK
eukprot:m.61650 g.61650  ORF g.61650 m.61650 type:complete len:235 (+) comp11433_c0_seq4:158-862(+)